jgi:hypothetical protein
VPEVEELIGQLRAEWLRSGLTLREIGERMGGVAFQNVSILLTPHIANPTLSTAVRLAAALGYRLVLEPANDV